MSATSAGIGTALDRPRRYDSRISRANCPPARVGSRPANIERRALAVGVQAAAEDPFREAAAIDELREDAWDAADRADVVATDGIRMQAEADPRLGLVGPTRAASCQPGGSPSSSCRMDLPRLPENTKCREVA